MAEVWTIGRILKWTEQFFAQKGIESPRLDAEVLLGHLLKKERIYLYVHFDEPLEKDELAAFHKMIKQRVSRVPVAYITGEKEFMGLPFKVTPATLVPRPDTEILVQAAIDALRNMHPEEGERLTFADIGTGSGAICLSILHELPEARACTVDISEEARAVAEENAGSLGVQDRVEFFTGDLLAPLAGRTFDAILSNPPYIPTADLAGLQEDVQKYEPRSALDGGTDGLDFYRRLTEEAPALLKRGGFLAVEVGIHQAEEVSALFMVHPDIQSTEIVKDLAGIPRVVMAYKEGYCG
ncbi:MAG: peptide chain release factor N(5)-glutamine methyltransferase [Selenomonas sp.]|nr:peptide chain release factor N(5)-glutamine methyltransferase [Selenomonas sp.]